jgi:hypothetical protein
LLSKGDFIKIEGKNFNGLEILSWVSFLFLSFVLSSCIFDTSQTKVKVVFHSIKGGDDWGEATVKACSLEYACSGTGGTNIEVSIDQPIKSTKVSSPRVYIYLSQTYKAEIFLYREGKLCAHSFFISNRNQVSYFRGSKTNAKEVIMECKRIL